MNDQLKIEHASLTEQHAPSERNIKAALDEMMNTFEAFKQANDDRLDEIENRQSSDVLAEEKVDRINKKLSQLNTMLQRPALAEQASQNDKAAEEKAALDTYIRSGNEAALQNLETHTFSSVDTQGGHIIPENTLFKILTTIDKASVVRQLATVQKLTNGNSLSVIRSDEHINASWVNNELTKRRTNTDTPSFTSKKISVSEIYSYTASSSDFLEDTGIDVESWLANNIAQSFADTESQAYATGSGLSQPKGLASLEFAVNRTPTSTEVQTTRTGVTSGFVTAGLVDLLLNFSATLRDRYRSNASWILNPKTLSEIRKAKDNAGNYIWLPQFAERMSSTLFGIPLYEDGYIPDPSMSKPGIIFGDISEAYVIAERRDITMLRDPYTEKPLVKFYATRRVGGDIINPNAMVYLAGGR